MSDLAQPAVASALRESYLACINRAIDLIVADLSVPLRLEQIAAHAGLSPFHFHRLFRAGTGETLAGFVNRLRLERALRLLAHDRRAKITDVALACGFATPSHFSRAFKQRYGQAPSHFDLGQWRQQRREELQQSMRESGSEHRLERLPAGENPDGFAPLIKRLPARQVAYIRVFEPFAPGRVEGAAQRLLAWASQRGLADGQWLGYMWDDPDCVPLRDCRYDVGLELPTAMECGGEIGTIRFPAMTVACLQIRGDIDLEQRALDWIYASWLPHSGYVPDEQPMFEAWVGRPFAFGTAHFELDLHLPVQRLGKR